MAFDMKLNQKCIHVVIYIHVHDGTRIHISLMLLFMCCTCSELIYHPVGSYIYLCNEKFDAASAIICDRPHEKGL